MGLSLFCFIVCLGWQYAASSPVTVTEYEYVREADAWLRLHIVPANWSDAALLCQLEGGVLASPTTGTVAESMLSIMNKHISRSSMVFIGVTDLYSKGDFRSLDGSGLANDLNWAKGEPSNTGNAEDCLALTGAGEVADVSCARVLPYFCSKSGHTCTSTTTENPADITSSDVDISPEPLMQPCISGYNWEPLTDSCYKFHGDAKTWPEALSTCQSEGGHLAIINSWTESSVLEKLYNDNWDTITGAEQEKHAFIGFRNFDGKWMTVLGKTLAEAGFEGWDVGEPSYGNGRVDEFCGSIHRNGRINDAGCHDRCPFICEGPDLVSLYFNKLNV